MKFPIPSIVKTEADKKELKGPGVKNTIVQTDSDFKQHLKELSQQFAATVILDGGGGETLDKIIGVLPFSSTIYSYGYLGSDIPLTIHTEIFMKGLQLKVLAISGLKPYGTHSF